jgi:hypothetical protein
MQASKLEATSSSLASVEGDLATQSRLVTAIGAEASASKTREVAMTQQLREAAEEKRRCVSVTVPTPAPRF